MKRRIIVIGKTGQLARALAAQGEGFNCQIESFGREACDLSGSAADVTAFTQTLPPCDGLIIAAAYTAVDAAENDKAAAFQVNGAAPAIFANYCRERAIPMVYVSTDYVFRGRDAKPISPDAPTDPINAYGHSKLAGETAIIDAAVRSIILRTSWVYDGSGKNFLTTMLSLGATRDSVNVVMDQIGRPTYAGHLAAACLQALNKLIDTPSLQGGVYHVTGSGEAISWAEFAKGIFAATQDSRAHDVHVTSIPTSDYPTRAKRPAYSVLDIDAFERVFNMTLPSWQSGLEAALNEWREGQ